MSSASRDFALEEVSFAELPGWQADDPSPLFPAMQTILSHLRQAKPYRTGSLGLNADELLGLLEPVDAGGFKDARAARQFFETHCIPFKITPSSAKSGFVTAFYEPELVVSATPDETFKCPIYRRPSDLIDLDEKNRPADMDPYYAFGLLRDGAISPYPDRGEIDRGYLNGRGLEIAWA